MEQVEQLYENLILHYGDGDRRELRAAAKLLLVALVKFREHGGCNWSSLLDEYIDALKNDPVKFERILESNRATSADELLA
ncbi:MAG: hypothetical protein N838_13540 [Thiohalocapsa sp. PB-PSB1]|nr:MAG: hypothetical protein N838_13540 [Thiohalocapsa sp. PB-PSB1]